MRLLLSFFIMLTAATAGLSAKEINPGDQAPALANISYVKGGEPQALDSGIVSVVELWATWCGPCRTSIPHLTTLQKKYGERLQIIGLSEEDVETVTPFVEEFGERMDYIVGAAAGESYATYGEGVRGIPFAYIVGKDGTVLWKGHPMTMDDPLDQIINGTFDMAKAEAIRSATEALEQSFQSNDLALIAETNNKLLALDPVNDMGIGVAIRLAEINEDRDAFRAVFTSIPDEDLQPTAAAKLLESMLGFANPSWIDAAQVQSLSQRVTADEAASTGTFLVAAKAAHFLGDIESAVKWANAAVEAQEDQAEAYKALYESIHQLQ